MLNVHSVCVLCIVELGCELLKPGTVCLYLLQHNSMTMLEKFLELLKLCCWIMQLVSILIEQWTCIKYVNKINERIIKGVPIACSLSLYSGVVYMKLHPQEVVTKYTISNQYRGTANSLLSASTTVLRLKRTTVE